MKNELLTMAKASSPASSLGAKTLLILFGLNLFLFSWGGAETMENKNPEIKWDKLSEKRIYFGHQSVGFNIVDGINDVLKENPGVKLNVVETTNPESFLNPVFAHSRAGKNTKPETKVDAFVNYIDSGIGKNLDYAFLKFCYVDIREKTDVKEVFEYYKTSFADLKQKYPRTTFVHLTVPLTTVQTGAKAFVKKIIGKSIGYEDNLKRHQLNALLKNEYKGKEPLFDIAGIESTGSDGKQKSYSKDGGTFHALRSEYTSDGGHLNETGRKLVALQLLKFLSELE
ncbi:MAG: hypothetical protein IEMM0002_1259 [bacterium]|nr:MAG: hypothetical protein IEMM0002_1259 [bacterium]